MALTLVPTAGAVDANCYCSLAEAEAYVATLSFATDWAVTDEAKKAAIITAARWLDTLRWKGIRSAQAQAMQWPRCGEYAVQFIDLTVAGTGYLLDRDGYQIPTDTIPTAIKNANAEMALRLLAEDRAADAGALVPSSLKLGSLDVQGLKRHLFPPSVLELCDWLLEVAPGQARLVRG